MIQAYWAKPGEKEEIIEFIDYVFSKAHRPHDFATLLPKLYGKDGDGAAYHFVVRENGKIMATVIAYPVVMRAGDQRVMTLGVGSVSTHPAARGKGYMKLIMDAVDERAKEIGAAFAVLGGQRQRYQYFGYDCAGYRLAASLEKDNVRHALRDVSIEGLTRIPMTAAHVPKAQALQERQPCLCERPAAAFDTILRTWNNEPFALLRDGTPIGFGTLRNNGGSCHVAELLLEDENDFPAVMKLLSGEFGTVTLCAAPWERQRAKWLAGICEEYCVKPDNMVKIYNQDETQRLCSAIDGFMPVSLPLYIAPPDCV